MVVNIFMIIQIINISCMLRVFCADVKILRSFEERAGGLDFVLPFCVVVVVEEGGMEDKNGVMYSCVCC